MQLFCSLGIKIQPLALLFSLSVSHSGVTQQSINTSHQWWPVPDFNLTCASSRSTLEAHKCDNMNVVLQKETPSCPLPWALKYWVWHGSNCMGSNQLDTQLKETWGLWAARQEAQLNSGDVHWTNLSRLLWQNCSFFSEWLDNEWESQGSEGGRNFCALLSAVPCLGETQGLKSSLSPWPNLSFPASPVHRHHRTLNRWMMEYLHCNAPIEQLQCRTQRVTHAEQNGTNIRFLCVCVKGINVQDKTADWNMSHTAKEKGIKRWRKDRK